MATITGLTADRMQQIIDKTIVSANIVSGHLILTLSDGSTVDAGNAVGPAGPSGAGLAKVTAFPASPADGDAIVRTDLPGSPIYTWSTENGWERYLRSTDTPPYARVYKTTSTQSIPDGGTDTAITFDAEETDTDNIHDNATNNTRLTCKTAGLYHIRALVTVQANANGTRWMNIRKNGTTILDQRIGDPNGNTTVRDSGFELSSIVLLAVNDYVEVTMALVEVGTSLLITGGQFGRGSKFSMAKIVG